MYSSVEEMLKWALLPVALLIAIEFAKEEASRKEKERKAHPYR
jgi:hypothetical protein